MSSFIAGAYNPRGGGGGVNHLFDPTQEHSHPGRRKIVSGIGFIPFPLNARRNGIIDRPVQHVGISFCTKAGTNFVEDLSIFQHFSHAYRLRHQGCNRGG